MARKTATDRIESLVYKIDLRYNPEQDAGPVTWADAALYTAVLALAAEVDSLHRRIAELEQRANE